MKNPTMFHKPITKTPEKKTQNKKTQLWYNSPNKNMATILMKFPIVGIIVGFYPLNFAELDSELCPCLLVQSSLGGGAAQF